jgi:hypothetical protein
MNVNNLRKNYENLTMLQRLALADNALGRDDESEALAIKNASPRVAFTQPDFNELYTEILNIRMCNLVIRLGYVMSFDLLLFDELEKLIDKSILDDDERINNDLRLTGFLYVRATDSWNAINEELGLRPNFDEELAQHLFAIDMLRSKDETMRAALLTMQQKDQSMQSRNRRLRPQTRPTARSALSATTLTRIRSGHKVKWMPTTWRPGAKAVQQTSKTVRCFVRRIIKPKEIGRLKF